MTSAPFTLKWGIMATGGIAQTFSKDVLNDPKTREVTDVRHEIVAVASSSDKARADDFVAKIGAPPPVRTYGSYGELVKDPGIDIVYVATPHSHHFQNAMLALEAGKHVLCEKAFTVTAAQCRKLVETARAKNLFLMEAVWTRYFPLSIKLRELVSSGVIGKPHRVIADLSINASKPDGSLTFDNSNRMVNLDLAGGAELDLGIYSLTWVFQFLYHLQPEADKERPTVLASIQKYAPTGADESTTIILNFPKHSSTGVALTSLRLNGHPTGTPPIRIQGSGGEIQVLGPAFKPAQYRVLRRGAEDHPEVVDCPVPGDPARGGWGHGMFWEADECARCLRDGRRESETLPLAESVVMMEVMEEALRQGGVTYPELIISDVYDPLSPLNTGKA